MPAEDPAIRLCALLGGVTSVRDARSKFYERHYP
jgi:hypothetical protein